MPAAIIWTRQYNQLPRNRIRETGDASQSTIIMLTKRVRKIAAASWKAREKLLVSEGGRPGGLQSRWKAKVCAVWTHSAPERLKNRGSPPAQSSPPSFLPSRLAVHLLRPSSPSWPPLLRRVLRPGGRWGSAAHSIIDFGDQGLKPQTISISVCASAFRGYNGEFRLGLRCVWLPFSFWIKMQGCLFRLMQVSVKRNV